MPEISEERIAQYRIQHASEGGYLMSREAIIEAIKKENLWKKEQDNLNTYNNTGLEIEHLEESAQEEQAKAKTNDDYARTRANKNIVDNLKDAFSIRSGYASQIFPNLKKINKENVVEILDNYNNNGENSLITDIINLQDKNIMGLKESDMKSAISDIFNALIENLKSLNIPTGQFEKQFNELIEQNVFANDIEDIGAKPKLTKNFNLLIDNMLIQYKSTARMSAIQHVDNSNSQKDALTFLSGNLDNANSTLLEQEKEAGAVSKLVNNWNEVFNKENAKSTLKRTLAETNREIDLLIKASNGELSEYDILLNGISKKTVSFEDEFQKLRGVKYNADNVKDCKAKADAFAQAEQIGKMVQEITNNLEEYTKSQLNSDSNPTNATAAIIKALNFCGVNKQSDINEILSAIWDKYKDNPIMKKSAGENPRIEKNASGKWHIYRTTNASYKEDIPAEIYQIIATELTKRVNETFLISLDENAENTENMSIDQLKQNIQSKIGEYKQDYLDSFKKAYGDKNSEELAQRYVEAQQKSVSNIELGINLLSTAIMLIPGGAVASSSLFLKGALAAKNSAKLGKLVKTLDLVQKGEKYAKFAGRLSGHFQKFSPLIMANMLINPTMLTEQMTSVNGMSKEEWEMWGQGVLMNSVYMSVGMGVGKIAEQAAAAIKTRELVKLFKNSGKSVDEISAILKANPTKFPPEIVKSFSKINTIATSFQVSSEIALDLTTTYALNKAMGNGDLLLADWINSVLFAVNGGVLQKQFAPLSNPEKVNFIMDKFKEFEITKDDAYRILQEMDNISSGKVRVEKNEDGTLTRVETDKPETSEVVGEKPSTETTNTEQNKRTLTTNEKKALLYEKKWAEYVEAIADENLSPSEHFVISKMIEAELEASGIKGNELFKTTIEIKDFLRAIENATKRANKTITIKETVNLIHNFLKMNDKRYEFIISGNWNENYHLGGNSDAVEKYLRFMLQERSVDTAKADEIIADINVYIKKFLEPMIKGQGKNLTVGDVVSNVEQYLKANHSDIFTKPETNEPPKVKNESTKAINTIKNLTEEEFYIKRTEIIEQAKNVGLTIDTFDIDKRNIFIIEKILSDEKLYNNEKIAELIGTIQKQYTDTEIVGAKLKLMDQYINDPELYNNPLIKDCIAELIIKTEQIEECNAKLKLIKEIINNKELSDSSIVKDNFSSLIKTTYSEEDAELTLYFLTELLKNKEITNIKEIANNLSEITNNLFSIKDVDQKINLLKSYANANNIIDLGSPKFTKFRNLIIEKITEPLYVKQLPNELNAILNNPQILNVLDEATNGEITSIDLTNKYTKDSWQLTIKAGENINSETPNQTIVLDIDIQNGTATLKSIEENYFDFHPFKKDDQKLSVKHNKDGTHVVAGVQYNPYNKPLSQRRTIYDEEGNRVSTEIIRRSKADPNEYEILICNKGETVQRVGTVTVSEDGKTITKEIKSSNGTTTKTTRTYNDNESSMSYQIIDKNGNIKMEMNRSSINFDKNHKRTTLNGQSYDIEYNSNNIVVSKLDAEGKPLERITLDSSQLDMNLMSIYRELSGDQLFLIKKLGVKTYLGGQANPNNACFNQYTNSISMSKELQNDTFVFTHELGHAIDDLVYKLHEDQNLLGIFYKELENYKAITTDLEGHVIDYFTTRKHENRDGCITEVIAETMALISGQQNKDEDTLLRGVSLQEHFPETIAYIANKLNQQI